jgi:endonuclease/exonuclease/phosphatase (EEP) superfamily protein YafD
MIESMHILDITDTSKAEGSVPSHGSVSPSQRHTWLGWICLIVAWATTLTLVILAALRILYHDGTYTLTCINAFTRYVYLPIYGCIVFAAWRRRKALLILGAFVAACHILLIAPEFVRDNRFDAPLGAPRARTLRILFANVLGGHPNPVDYLRELPEIDPDVIVFVEYYPWWHRDADPAKTFAAYPYGTMGAERPGGEFGVFSKIPIEHARHVPSAGRMCFTFDIRVDGKALRLFALHAPRPMLDPEVDYSAFWSIVTPEILALPDPAVVVGDFNATPYSKVYKKLTADRLRSAHEDRGRGYATTWPNRMEFIPPIRIDQALLTPGVECVSITEGRGAGSDHKPLIIDVRLRIGGRSVDGINVE